MIINIMLNRCCCLLLLLLSIFYMEQCHEQAPQPWSGTDPKSVAKNEMPCKKEHLLTVSVCVYIYYVYLYILIHIDRDR